MATGLLGVGLPAASAHTGVLDVSSVCQDDGTRLVTYTGTTRNVPSTGSGHEATLTVGEIRPTGTPVSPTTQTVVGNTTFTFTQTVPGATQSAQATAFLVWGDGAKSDPIGHATFTTDCTPAPPAKPAPEIVVTHSDVKDCDATEVTTTTVTTTTGWILVNNVWVKDTPVVTQKVTTRPATAQECPVIVPAKPAPEIVVTHSDAKDCDATEVTTTTVTTTTGWILVNNVWVKDTPVVTQKVTTRPTTAQECPVVVVPADSVPEVVAPEAVVVLGAQAAVNPLPVSAAAGEAKTSDQLVRGGVIAFAAFLVLGAGFVLRRRDGDI